MSDKLRKNKYIGYGFLVLGFISVFYLFSTTPAYFYFFGLGRNDHCKDFRKAPIKAKVDFLLGCGCLTEELSDMVTLFDMKDKVNDCFINKVQTCSGPEQIGDIYRECTKSILKNDYQNTDIEEVYWQNKKRMNEILKKSGVEPSSDKQIDRIMIESYKNAYDKIMNHSP